MFLLMLLGCFAAVRAASVRVTMPPTAPTMTLVDRATNEQMNIGAPERYVYSFDAAPGTYVLTAYGRDGETVNGTIGMTVEDKAETQEFSVLIVTLYATNRNDDGSLWTVENGDYSIEVSVVSEEGTEQNVALGNSTTPGRKTVPVYEGNTVNARFIPSATLHPEYLAYTCSATVTSSTSLSGLIPKGTMCPITVPKDAELIIGPQIAEFVDVVPAAPSSIVENGDTKTFNFYLPDGANYDICTYMEGKLTQKGYFIVSDKGLTFPMSDYEAIDPKTVYHDVNSNNGYETGDIFVNINHQGHLRLDVGDIFHAHGMRSWELTDNVVNNHFMEPDFHYTVIGLDGEPCDNVISVNQQPGKAWAEIKAVGEGTAIVLVTYDATAVAIYRNGTVSPFDGGRYWGAIWPENTAAYVVTVGQPESTVVPNMFINEKYNFDTQKLAGMCVDAEHDVFYYLDTEEGAHYTFKPDGVEDITIAFPLIGDHMATYSGFSSEGITENEDGSYTLHLKEGRQIVRMTDAAGNAVYQVLTAKTCHREISNNTRPGSSVFLPGDEVKVRYSGLRHPANKMGAIYNMSAYVTYNDTPNGTSLIQSPNQYKFGSSENAQTMTFIIPEDYDVEANPEMVLNEGVIQVNGYGDPIGSHRSTDYMKGRSKNFASVAHKTYFGYLPEISINLKESGIGPVVVDGSTIASYYNLEGFRSDRPFRGMNIVRYSDGTARKVYVK